MRALLVALMSVRLNVSPPLCVQAAFEAQGVMIAQLNGSTSRRIDQARRSDLAYTRVQWEVTVLDPLKSAIRGTPLEPVTRTLVRTFSTLTSQSAWIRRKDERYDRQATEIMSRVLSASSNCVDIGARNGAILSKMIRIAPKGRHFAFEPLPDYFEQLCANFPDVQIYDIALSNSKGIHPFYRRVNNPATSSLHSDNDFFDKTPPVVLSVETDTLDHMIPRETKIDFIKIDVEGAQLQVFQGAINTIRASRPYIVFEHGGNRIADCEPMFRLLVDVGRMKISLMADWLGGREPLTLARFIREVKGRWPFAQTVNWYFLAHP